MKIIVCVKMVSDPEAPASLFKVDETAKRVIPPKGTPPVLNPFDENALEAALKIKDVKGKDASITILSMGKNIARPVIRKSLATGADNLILLEDEGFDELDTCSTANILVSAIKKIGAFDLILCGREAADTDAGQTGLGIAEILGIPSVNLASKIEVSADKLKVERLASDGYDVVELAPPAVVTVSSELGTIRSANMAGIMAAQKKPMTVWKAADIGVNPSQLRKTKLFRLFQPVRDTKCEVVAGAGPEEAAANLASRLREAKVI